MTTRELTDSLKSEARRLGFDDVGITPAVAAPGYPHLVRWLEAGHEAGMGYMRQHAAARAHPDSVLDGVRSIVVVSVVYGHDDRTPEAPASSRGKVARYAQGADYHGVMWDRLGALLRWLHDRCPAIRGRAVADTAPLLERDYARLAGLGWIGKNTMLISRRLGSFTLLGALLIDAELSYDAPHHPDHCGTCTRCLEACPTDAFVGPYQLDARRCISYWTIEHKEMLTDREAPNLHGWVFGCDICQDVCPWNRKAPAGREPAFDARPEWTDPDLIEWLSWSVAEWKAKLKGTALSRSRRVGLLRNAALVLGTRGLIEAVEPLAALLDDFAENATIRASAAWALGRIGTDDARAVLVRHESDGDSVVRQSVRDALCHIQTHSSKKDEAGENRVSPAPPLEPTGCPIRVSPAGADFEP